MVALGMFFFSAGDYSPFACRAGMDERDMRGWDGAWPKFWKGWRVESRVDIMSTLKFRLPSSLLSPANYLFFACSNALFLFFFLFRTHGDTCFTALFWILLRTLQDHWRSHSSFPVPTLLQLIRS